MRRRPARAAAAAVLAAAALLAAACGGAPPAGDAAVVATVGDAVITADDFARSYELGFTHLKHGDDPRGAYLQHMIDEALLAREGYRQGLDADPEVQAQVANLRAELLVEQVFEREVNRHVEVTDAEIDAAMQQERVQFRLRYLPAPGRAAAERLAQAARTEGFDAARDRVLAADAGRGWRPEDFESPYLTAADLDPALLQAVADLPVGAVSAPVPYRGSYVLLQVADVRRAAGPPAADAEARARYRQVVFQQKAKEAAGRYLRETLQPLDLRLKPAAFRALRDALYAWYRDEPPARSLRRALEAAEGPDAARVRALYADTLFTTRDGAWTVAAFLDAYPVSRYPLTTATEEAFQGALYDAVGLTVRDRAFVARAEAEGWDEAPEVEAELARWRDKWVHRALLARIADTVLVSDADARAAFERRRARYAGDDGTVPAFEAVAERVRADERAARVRARLAPVLAELRARYPVEVRRAVLDTLGVADPSGRASPDVLFFKGHTGRPAYPVVDPSW